MEANNLKIPEFIYLNDQKVNMTISWIEGSVPVKNRSKTSSNKSKHGGANIGFQGIIGVNGGLDSSSTEEQEELREQNEYSKFARLYRLLHERNGIINVDKLDTDVIKQLQRGQIVEIESYVTLSPMDTMFRLLTSFIPLINETTTNTIKDTASTNALISLFQQAQKKGIDAFIISENNPECRLYMSLLVDKFKSSIDELPSTLFTLGRVTKILSENETVNLSSKYFGGLKLPEEYLQDLVNQLSKDSQTSQMFGNIPTLEDMIIKYPAVAISPIALYR